MMNLHHLRVFSAVASEGSVTRAAKRLRVSQPAVSQQIKELERWFDLTLLNRLPKGVSLTPEGRVLSGYAERIFEIERSCELMMSAYAERRVGRLSVGASTTIFDYLLPGLIQDFSQGHPDVELSLEVGNTHEVLQLLLDGTIELGFFEGSRLSTGDEVDLTPFGQDELVIVTHPNSELSKLGPRVSGQRLAQERYLSREDGSGSSEVVHEALEGVGVRLKPHLHLGSTTAILRSAVAGMGFGVVSELAARPLVKTGALAQLTLKGTRILRPLFVGKVRRRHLSQVALAFLEQVSASPPTAQADPG